MELSLYPEIEPYRIGTLPVSHRHSLYYEESGNPYGQPVVFLHGGPGSASAPNWRRYFHPGRYRIILFDQRGCGLSTPYACLEENTTSDLVADTEKLRLHLKVDQWLLVGGSWGSTLALAYAQSYPEPVSGLIMYGLFLGTKEEIQWFYQSGADCILPDAFEDFRQLVPIDQRHEIVKAYYRLLNVDNPKIQAEAAFLWSQWEARALRLIPDPALMSRFTEPERALAQARIECHYFINDCFLSENQLVDNIPTIANIPCTIIHGRYDLICPLKTSWQFRAKWPQAKLIIVPDAAHSATESGILKELIAATDRFSKSSA